MPIKLALCSLLFLVPTMATAQRQVALTYEAELQTAPYHIASVPNVSVHVPGGFDAKSPLHLVVYVHGLRGCLPVLMGQGESRCDANAQPQLGWDLGTQHDAAQTNTLFIVPRLYYDKRGGQPGAFGKAGGFRAFVDELVSGPVSARLGRQLSRADVASVTLIAHSAGYETALAILEHGDMPIRAVVLLDALYDLEDRYGRYALAHAKEGFRLIAIHLRGGRPAANGRKLERRLLRALGPELVVTASASELRSAIAAHPFVFADGRGPHAQVPRQHMAEVLAALGLPARTNQR